MRHMIFSSNLLISLINLTKEDIMLCSFCGLLYANEKLLNNHVRENHLKDELFSCNICGHVSAQKRAMFNHMRMHNKTK